jgi:hypothetical protein
MKSRRGWTQTAQPNVSNLSLIKTESNDFILCYINPTMSIIKLPTTNPLVSSGSSTSFNAAFGFEASPPAPAPTPPVGLGAAVGGTNPSKFKVAVPTTYAPIFTVRNKWIPPAEPAFSFNTNSLGLCCRVAQQSHDKGKRIERQQPTTN